MKWIYPLFFIFSSYCSFGQDLLTARSQALGGTATFAQNADAALANPAGLVGVENWFASASFERRYLLADLDFIGVAGGFSTASGSFGFAIEQFGFAEFKQQEISIGYGRKLSTKLSIGGKVKYHRIDINEYGSENAIGFELGLQARLSKELLIGTHLLNPIPTNRVSLDDFASIFRVGAAFIPTEKVMVGFELEKDIDFPVRVKAGVEYGATERFDIRAGFSSEMGQVHFGFGLDVSEQISIDTAIRYHQTLGMTPTFGLSMHPKG